MKLDYGILVMLLSCSVSCGSSRTAQLLPNTESDVTATKAHAVKERSGNVRQGDWTFRISGGQGTYSEMTDYLQANIAEDKTGFYGLDVGRVVVRELNEWPIDIVAHVGLARHFEQDKGSDFFQYRAYLKAYWTRFPWNEHIRTRIGVGEGLSYCQHVPHVERSERNHHTGESHLLNYMDITVSVNAGDLFNCRELDHCWLGTGLSHRSGIYGLINGVNGGSNYHMVFLEAGFSF